MPGADMLLANIILFCMAFYLVIGVAVGVGFIFRGVCRVDSAAAHSPIGFRLIIFPGCCVLWPVVLRWWIHGRSAA